MSPIAIVLFRYARDGTPDEIVKNEGWPDPTSVTNLNLRFFLLQAGLFVPRLPENGHRQECADRNGYGKDGILYFTNAIPHWVKPEDINGKQTREDAATELLPKLKGRSIVVALGKYAEETVKKALALLPTRTRNARIGGRGAISIASRIWICFVCRTHLIFGARAFPARWNHILRHGRISVLECRFG